MKPAVMILEHAAQYVTLSESLIQKKVREKTFPAPRLLSGRRVGWLTRELDEWTEALPVADLPPPVNCSAGRGDSTT